MGPGENIKVKLKGVEEEDVSPGFILCDPINPVKTCRIFDGQVKPIVSKLPNRMYFKF